VLAQQQGGGIDWQQVVERNLQRLRELAAAWEQAVQQGWQELQRGNGNGNGNGNANGHGAGR